ncbi:MAG: hypothetical protein NVS3B12_12600 [Acidimicrobiales bacterium]
MTVTLNAPRRSGVADEPLSSDAGSDRGLPRRIALVLVGLASVAALVAVHLVLSSPMRVPIIHPDELGYLENARFLARGGLRSETEYYPGFSLLLVPLWWLGTAPLTIYRQTLGLEAVLAGLGGWATWRLTPRLAPGLSGWRRLVLVAMVSVYPPFLLFGDFALAETAFAAMFAVVVLAAANALPSRRPSRWAVLGLTSGLLTLVHPRGLAVVVAAGLAGLVVLGLRRSSLAPLLAMSGGMVASLALTRWLVTYVKGPASNGFAAYRPDGIISKSLSLHGASSLIAELAGQLFYLSVATAGLVPLGLLVGGRALVRTVRGDRAPWVLTQAFATTAFCGVWALSSLFMNLGDRADKLIYGRYNEGVIVPLLVIALAEMLDRSAPGRTRHLSPRRFRAHATRRWIAAGAGTVVVSGLFVQYGHSAAERHQTLNPVNVLALAPILTRDANRIDPILIAALAITAIVTVALLSWRLPVVAALVLILGFAASTVDTQTRYVVPGTRARAAQDDIAEALTALRLAPGVDTSCIGYDAEKGIDYNYYNDRFLLPGQRFVWFDGSRLQSPCGTLVVSRRADFAARYPEARLILAESYQPQSLWAVARESDATFTALSDGGWLSPPSPSATGAVALGSDARRGAVLSVDRRGPLTLPAGTASSLRLTVAHQGGGAPWPAAAALHTGEATFAVQVAVRWYPDTDPLANPGDPRACPSGVDAPVAHSCPPPIDLPRTLLPGARATIPIRLDAQDSSGRPLTAGAYRVQIGLLQQGVGSFADPPLELAVTVD